MRKVLVSLVSLITLVSLVSLTSCKKEENGNGTQFRATMEDCTSTKTELDGTALNWVAGDLIKVYGNTGSGIYTATPQTPATVAVFDNVSGETGNAPFRAYYPSTLTSNGVNITLPATQAYVEGSINEFPMYAESNDNQLAFKNLCGVLKLHLTKANTNISSITITAASEINGTFSVDYNGGDPELEYSANGTNTTTLTCTTAQSIAEGKDFYIYLPEGNYSGLQIEMTTDDNRYCIKTANTAINVTRSQYTLITLGSTLEFRPVGSKGGLFSVSATQQVWFSQGNLQYQASTDTWRFAEHQYDMIGAANSNISATYSGWIDLFGWGTGSNPTLASNNYADYNIFGDWGTNTISNGGNQTCQWHSLSYNEWNYLINTRIDANSKLGTGSVNGVHGIILLPDHWSLPDNCSFNPCSTSSTEWSNSYTISQWADMESNGAIFLPAAGYRNYNLSIADIGYAGRYWSSTLMDAIDYAHQLYFNSSEAHISYAQYLGVGRSVRLVRDNN